MIKPNNGYRCLKCEGKNSIWHGLYCPKRKNNVDKVLEKIKQQTDDVYNEKDKFLYEVKEAVNGGAKK